MTANQVGNQETQATNDPAELDTVSSIRKIVDTMQLAENIRAKDRALIDVLANGERPYTPDEVEKYQIKYNINWGEMNKQLRDANRQCNGALLFKPTLFTATSLGGQVEKRDEYGQKFTTIINRHLKRKSSGKYHTSLLMARNASVCLHGLGVVYWPNDYEPLPKFVPLENLLIPTDTDLDFSNLSYFDIKVEMTPYQLYECTHGEKVDKGWNLPQVEQILIGLKDLQGVNPNNYNWVQYPEKMQEIFKQNRTYLDSDSVAKVKLDYFFTKKKEDGLWYLKIFIRESIGPADPDDFVYETDQPFASELNRIFHVQIGDNNIVPPNKYHSTRGLGQSLYSAAEALNRFRSGLFQHGEEQLRMYFYVDNPTDKSRQNVIELFQYGIIETGIRIVPEQERHQVDSALIESIMSQCRQNLSENSSSFVQDINDGTAREMTLGEAQIRQQSVNVAVSSLLTMMYENEVFYYEEIVRRSLRKNSGDKGVEAFQKELIEAGIPEELLTADNWDIQIERVLGAGDQTIALQEAGALMQARSAYDPKAQRQILKTFTSTITRDPAKAAMLVPDTKDDSTSGAMAAEDVFGTLMLGAPVSLREGITQNDYIETMLKMAGAIIQQITQTDNMGTQQQIIGLDNVFQDCQKHIAILEADPKQGMNVKMYGDAVGKLGNLVKAFAQRLAAANAPKQAPKVLESISFKDLSAFPQAQSALLQAVGLPSQMEPQADPKVAKAQQGLAINAAKFKQKQEQSAIAFEMSQIQKLTEHQTNLSIQQQEANQQLVHNHVQKLQELMLAQQAADNQPEPAAKES